MSLANEGTKNHDSIFNNNPNIKNIEVFKKYIKTLNYEDSMAELEVIVKNIQDENISLDQIKNDYIKGHLLLKNCEELLQFVEQEINQINPEFLNVD